MEEDFVRRPQQFDTQNVEQLMVAWLSQQQRAGSNPSFHQGTNIANTAYITQNWFGSSYASAAPPPPSKHRIFLCYDEKDQLSWPIVAVLEEHLKDRYELLVLPFSSSYKLWHGDLYTAAGLSHAAIVLLSSRMFQENKEYSDSIYKTMNLLAAQTLRRVDAFAFVIPILLDHLDLSGPELTDARMIASVLENFSPFQSSDPLDICAHVVEQLQSLKKEPRFTYLDLLGYKIGQILRHQSMPAPYLASLLDRKLDSTVDSFMQIGWAMWRHNILANHDMFNFISNMFEEPGRKHLLQMLFPSWVDPWAALWVPIAAERAPGERALVLNHDGEFIVNCFIRRAYCCSFDHSFLSKARIIDMTIDASDGTSLPALIEKTREELSNQLGGRAADLEQRLKRHVERYSPVFVVMPWLGPEAILQLMNEFKDVTFFFLIKNTLPEDIHLFGKVIFPEPSLCQEDFDAYYDYCQFLLLKSK